MAGFETRIICGRTSDGQVAAFAVGDLVSGGGAGTTGSLLISIAPHVIQSVCGTVAAAGNTNIITPPPAGQRIVIANFVVQNETAVATTIQLRDGAVTNHYRALCQNQGDGLALVFPAGREWPLSDGQPLVINLSGANQCNYSVAYWVEAA